MTYGYADVSWSYYRAKQDIVFSLILKLIGRSPLWSEALFFLCTLVVKSYTISGSYDVSSQLPAVYLEAIYQFRNSSEPSKKRRVLQIKRKETDRVKFQGSFALSFNNIKYRGRISEILG